MTKEEMIKWIDNASYETLLRKWRFAAAGDPFFAEEIGAHYTKVMNEKQNQVDHVAISKRIGWGRNG